MSLKKLKLNRETVMSLTHDQQAGVEGGGVGTLVLCPTNHICATKALDCHASANTAKGQYQCC